MAAVGVVVLLLTLDAGLFGLRPGGFAYGGGVLGVLLLLWAAWLAIRIAFWTSRAARGGYGGRGGAGRDPALFIARRRYARGEISREQYDQIVSDLQRPAGPR